MPNVENGTRFKMREASDWEKENTNMKYKFQFKFDNIAKQTNPRTGNMPQPFNWDPNVNYTLKNGLAKVYDPKQQKTIPLDQPDADEEPEDLSTFKLTFMSTADASPAKKQKLDNEV